MCKHTHATLVAAWLDDGDPFRVYQCDMCGLTVLDRDIGDTEDGLPPIDTAAQAQALARIWKAIMLEIAKPYNAEECREFWKSEVNYASHPPPSYATA